MRGKLISLLMLAAAMPVLAQQKPLPDNLPKVPTPPPAVSERVSIIGPEYANPPESVADVNVPQGELREFILYSQDSKLYPGIVRVANMTRDAYGNYSVPPSGISAPGQD